MRLFEKMIASIFCIFSTLSLLAAGREIYLEIPDNHISHCSRKLSVYGQVGCSSRYPGSVGKVTIVNDSSSCIDAVTAATSDLILVIPLNLFLDQNLTKWLRNSQSVAALVVFSPNFPNTTSEIPEAFSENVHCPNGAYTLYNNSNNLCNTTPKWNPSASDYAFISWPFPIILVDESEEEVWSNISSCYESFNRISIDDTSCQMEISNYMAGVNTSQTCYTRQKLAAYHLDQSATLCNDIGGANIMLRARNTTTPPNSTSVHPDPTVLVVSRVDAVSMFDRRATSALSVLPAVSVFISAAVHLLNQPTIKDGGSLRKNLVFVLLDNEALGFSGSQRFSYDLMKGRLAGASGLPITMNEVESIIELGGVGLPQRDVRTNSSNYYLYSDLRIDPRSEGLISSIWQALNASAAASSGFIRLLNGSVVGSHLPPSASTQALLKSFMEHLDSRRPDEGEKVKMLPGHTFISDRPAKPPFADPLLDSFLDRSWKAEDGGDETLLALANVLADALHRVVTADEKPIPEPITSVTPGELMYCFLVNPACDLLTLHLEPTVVEFLVSLGGNGGGGIPMQTYEAVEGRQWRVSQVVSRLLLGLTGERLAECPPPELYGAFSYMYGYYNGSMWCYRSLMETATSFLFLEGGRVAAPGWVRSSSGAAQLKRGRRGVRLFRAASRAEENVALGLGLALSIATAVIGIVMRRFSSHLFRLPYVNHPLHLNSPPTHDQPLVG